MIYLLRHGLDDEKYIGGYSNVELTLEGIKQVEETLDYLKKNNLKIEQIVSSDIKRAIQTSEIINQELKLNITYNQILRELDKGKLNGMLKAKAKILFPDYVNINNIYKKYLEGESMIEFYERIKNNVDKILAMDNALLITHRGVINMLYYILKNIEVDYDKEKFNVTHASLHELDPIKKTIRRIK